ncbi:MAG: hypothetical protein HY692_08415 [Cyanobacteria bacterium NC_groundwater_1444_Ag_S-0.65um_54_12]|nr:hypothetical protein [Cyanobacteria bacterium NC_groundwater_1444_Ag_S-0.65um_54_12]
MKLGPRNWNNGDLSRSRHPARRFELEHQVLVNHAPDQVFAWCRWVPGAMPDEASGLIPYHPSSANAEGITWNDTALSEALFAQTARTDHHTVRWITTLLDPQSWRLHALFTVADLLIGMLAVEMTPVQAQADKTRITIRLTCTALCQRGNRIMGQKAEEGSARWLQQLGDAIRQFADQPLPGGTSPDVIPARNCRQEHVSHTVEVNEKDLVFSREAAFAMACPVAELDWIEDWSFDLVYSASGRNEEHCIFKEALSAPLVQCRRGHTIWYTTRFVPSTGHFDAVLLTGSDLRALFRFAISELAEGRWRLRWDLTCLGIDDRGNSIIAQPGFRKRMAQMLQFLERSALHYLRSGTMYRVPLKQKAGLVFSRVHAALTRHIPGLLARKRPAPHGKLIQAD